MRARLETATLFPLRYSPGALLPAAAIAGGFFGLETLLHGRHALAPVSLPAAFAELKGLPVWEAVYQGAYGVYIAPLLLPAMRVTAGAVRRLLAGFASLLAVGALVALLSAGGRAFELVPCLLVSNSVFVLACLLRQRLYIPALSAFGLTLLVVLATMLTQRHDAMDIGLGIVAGYCAYRLAFWKELWFLERASPWQYVDYELRDIWNLLVRNSRGNWEATYAAGQWEFLESAAQKPRHYVIAGAVADRFPQGAARVLDVGCGYGTLYPLLRGRIAAYDGLDLSDEAVRKCRRTFADDDRCRFVQASFEEFAPRERYDVIVLNEVLYYFPSREAWAILRKAASLAADGGVVIVSMNRNWKATFIWRALAGFVRPEQSLQATNLETGSYWTINVYSAAKMSS